MTKSEAERVLRQAQAVGFYAFVKEVVPEHSFGYAVEVTPRVGGGQSRVLMETTDAERLFASASGLGA